jgi:alkylation response protein AidB-like acyl-CoA dehydrogenase
MAELVERETLDFFLYEWLRLDDKLAQGAYADHTRESVDAMLDTATRLAENEFLPCFKKGDRQEPYQDEDGAHVIPEIRSLIKAYADAGFFAAGFPQDMGGLGLPTLVQTAASAIFSAANVPALSYSTLAVGNARLIARYGTALQRHIFVEPQIAGDWTGTMALSEPQAGSSLGDIVTRALPDGEDALGPRYRRFGNKMWISGGDHDASDNIVHLVLAKIPGPDGRLVDGAKGISIFIVPKFIPDLAGGAMTRNDIVLAGLNHKMGFRGTTNCLLNFGEGTRFRPMGQAGAVGWRIGDVGQGLPIMFFMMNEARVGIGLGAAMMGYRGFRLALDYARSRPQGRPAGSRDPASKQVPIIEHADVRNMLLACKAYSEGALALLLYCARLIDETHDAPTPEGRGEAAALLALLTPVAKTFPSEFGLAANDIAIQVHGGYGYTRDYDVEQLYRDNRLNPIHEGTTGVQAMDLLGRKILRDATGALGLLTARIEAAIAEAPSLLSDEATSLRGALGAVQSCHESLRACNSEAEALANATNFLRAFGHVVVGFIWLSVGSAASGRAAGGALREGKIAACRYFFAFEMPKVAAWLAPVAGRSRVTLEMRDGWF